MLKPIKSNKQSEAALAKASSFHLPISSNNSEDLTVEDLGISENLSVRSMNACKQEHLFTLSAIVKHYEIHGTFLNIRNVGTATNLELVNLCIQHMKNDKNNPGPSSTHDLESGRLLHLNKLTSLSRRARTCLNKNNLVTVQDLLDYFDRKKKFIKLRGLDKRINAELLWFVEHTHLEPVGSITKKKTPTRQQEISDDSTLFLLRDYFSNQFKTLSVRSQNVIRATIHNVQFDVYKEQLLYKNIQALKLKNAGTRTINEIIKFNEKIERQIQDFLIHPVKIDNEYFTVTTALSSKLIPVTALMKYESLFLAGEFPLFTIFQNEFLKRGVKEIYQPVLKFLLNRKYQSLSNTDIGKRISLTAERVRQLKYKMYPLLMSFFDFNKEISNKIISSLGYLNIDNGFIDLSKIRDNSPGSDYKTLRDDFVTNAITNLMEKNYTVLKIEHSESRILIQKKLFDSFNFVDFQKIIGYKIKEKREGNEVINFETFLRQFTKNGPKSNFLKAKIIGEYLLNTLDYYLNENGEIIFEKNSDLNLDPIIFSIIKKNASPIKLTEINSRLQELIPSFEFSEPKLRAQILAIKNISYFKSADTYGINNEVIEKKANMGPTLRNLVVEILVGANKPLHISEIFYEVSKFRNTNEKNLLISLRSDTIKFSMYGCDFFGLVGVFYPSELLDKINSYGNAIKLINKMIRNKTNPVTEIVWVMEKSFGFTHEEIVHWFKINNSNLATV